jgi:phasin family protein
MTKETYTPPFWEDTMNTFKNTKTPWVDMETLMTNYRRNMDLINSTQQIVGEATKSVLQLQTQYVKNVFDQMSEQTKHSLATEALEAKTEPHTERAKATVDQAIAHAREVNTVIAKSNEKIIENFQNRFKESVDESASLAKKAKGKI